MYSAKLYSTAEINSVEQCLLRLDPDTGAERVQEKLEGPEGDKAARYYLPL